MRSRMAWVEVITLRVIGVADVEPLRWAKLAAANGTDIDEAFLYRRPTTFDDGQTLDTPRYDRLKLRAGHRLKGPAIVVQRNSTTMIPPGFDARVSDYGNIHIRAS